MHTSSECLLNHSVHHTCKQIEYFVVSIKAVENIYKMTYKAD